METEGFYMAEKRWRTWETVGLLVVLAAGNLLHFIYDWTGQSPIAAPLAAVNESTWEHMKLFITPWVLWSLVECIVRVSATGGAMTRLDVPILGFFLDRGERMGYNRVNCI